ncbi:MAG: exodeoxyribonuclease VII small subunit, partial [Lachnospiraceae bacterium]|nr:exodeoxyribonuclease VII small subunit [Lachnospiraceae bacterium]
QKKQEKNVGIEESFAMLDKIIDKMNSGKCTIEENIKRYEEGSIIIKNVKKNIDNIEKKLDTLGG